MKAFKQDRMELLQLRYHQHGWVTCPECGSSLEVMTSPLAADADSRLVRTNFLVSCPKCGCQGTLESEFVSA